LEEPDIARHPSAEVEHIRDKKPSAFSSEGQSRIGHHAELKLPGPAINVACCDVCIVKRRRLTRVEERDEIGLWTADPGAGL